MSVIYSSVINHSTCNLSKPLMSSELLKLCLINGEYPQWDGSYIHEELIDCLEGMKQYLLSASVLYMEIRRSNDICCISGRQVNCAINCMKALEDKNWGVALHELSDCIDDYAKGLIPNRIINQGEYILYLALVSNFLNAYKTSENL